MQYKCSLCSFFRKPEDCLVYSVGNWYTVSTETMILKTNRYISDITRISGAHSILFKFLDGMKHCVGIDFQFFFSSFHSSNWSEE